LFPFGIDTDTLLSLSFFSPSSGSGQARIRTNKSSRPHGTGAGRSRGTTQFSPLFAKRGLCRSGRSKSVAAREKRACRTAPLTPAYAASLPGPESDRKLARGASGTMFRSASIPVPSRPGSLRWPKLRTHPFIGVDLHLLPIIAKPAGRCQVFHAYGAVSVHTVFTSSSYVIPIRCGKEA